MKILVTNDDGIYAPGLWALAEELSQHVDIPAQGREFPLVRRGTGQR